MFATWSTHSTNSIQPLLSVQDQTRQGGVSEWVSDSVVWKVRDSVVAYFSRQAINTAWVCLFACLLKSYLGSDFSSFLTFKNTCPLRLNRIECLAASVLFIYGCSAIQSLSKHYVFSIKRQIPNIWFYFTVELKLLNVCFIFILHKNTIDFDTLTITWNPEWCRQRLSIYLDLPMVFGNFFWFI